MDKENKRRRGIKRQAAKGETKIIDGEQNDEKETEAEEIELFQAPRRRSARLIAISKPNLYDERDSDDHDAIGREEASRDRDLVYNEEDDDYDEQAYEKPKQKRRAKTKSMKKEVKSTPEAPKKNSSIFVGGSATSSSTINSSLFSFGPESHQSSSSSHPKFTSSTPMLHSSKSFSLPSKKPICHGIEGTSCQMLSASSDDGEDEWEAMEVLHAKKDEKDGVEVHLEGKAVELFKTKLRNPLEERNAKEAEERAKWEHEMELEIARKRRELQENLHRVHFLAYIGHLHFMVDSLLRNRAKLTEKLGSLFSNQSVLNSTQMSQLIKKEFRVKFCCQNDIFPAKSPSKWCTNEADFGQHLLSLIDQKGFNTAREISLLFFAFCAFVLEQNTRICVAFNPMPRLLKEPKRTAKKKEEKGSRGDERKKTEESGNPRKRNPKMKSKKKKNNEESEDESSSLDDDDESKSDGEEKAGRRKKRARKVVIKKEKVKDEGKMEEEAYWNEYWDEVERRWICVDAFHGNVDQPEQIEAKFGMKSDGPHKMLYVLAMDNHMGVREIGAKYAQDWLKLATRRLRTDAEWIRDTMGMKSFRADETRARLEDAQIHELLKSRPMPTTLVELKNHPLYALKKDLLKFEAIYPADTAPVGHVGAKQKMEVYPRSAVHKLEGSLNWIKECRSIKAGEQPYKVVSARPKLNIPKEKREPLTLDLFGYWQTEPYVPPEVTPEGRIPRNEFGNLYMYKEEMLPKGCVHLRLPGIYQLARRLDLEAVPAVIGWEFSGGFNHPILDGCVVLRRDEEVLRSAWQETAREKAAKEAKRAAERVWNNWRKLIRGKRLLEQMRTKFGGGGR